MMKASVLFLVAALLLGGWAPAESCLCESHESGCCLPEASPVSSCCGEEEPASSPCSCSHFEKGATHPVLLVSAFEPGAPQDVIPEESVREPANISEHQASQITSFAEDSVPLLIRLSTFRL